MTEVWRPRLLTRQQMEERRFAALPFLRDRTLSSTVLARQFGVAPTAIRAWRQRLAQGDSLEATRSTGRPAFLTDEQVAELMDIIRAGPDPQQYDDGRWTTARIRDLIGRKYGVWYDRDWVGKLLVRWGFSWQKAEKRPLEQKTEQIDEWLEAELPVLEKKDRRG
ncbi:winged helix-turn-helix domain-containing protein [Deinococcus sp.]|uniref:winged helix-turn-helix domain-containing protein n=1 Tax=Deinococcus sp. TaxID=47478 RepID=UPI0025BE4707|nr:winged helix-turn-helix domain-containing protein [Deinococcus sp.]